MSPRPSRSWLRALVLMSLMSTGGCAALGPRADPFGDETTPISIVIQAQNRYHEDVVLHARTTDGTVRLGSIQPTQGALFRFPLDRPLEFRIRVEVLAGPYHETNAILVNPGDSIELWITARVENSFIRRR